MPNDDAKLILRAAKKGDLATVKAMTRKDKALLKARDTDGSTPMPYFDQAQFDLRCEWGMAGVEQLAPADVIVIVDVLSFTTSVDIAVGRGAIVLPYRWKDESAVQYAARARRGTREPAQSD